ncbi:glycosyltransferase [Hyphomonas pacifica]|uniref:Uncharacterized protein n=1 Tax=Hyphomonas pacifica TaxID=1280941 RepID=A0A062TUK6_9PROT|nr:glycosyltransferase [Hyphomonas pacifica]KCZ51671.1 hypothetical protein HY2_01580 [Hyphomonas pacifica]RAN34340.1 hypothetical protein HY3_01665 [Hyphomonas pacifica]
MSQLRGLLCTYGTRGDVEPFLALAQGLKAAGVDVTLATSERYKDWVEGAGIACFPMSDAPLALIDSPDGKMMLEGAVNVFKRMAAGMRLAKKSAPLTEQMITDSWNAAQTCSPDFIVFHSKQFGAPHIAEKLGIPAFLALLQPMIVPTAEFPAMGLPALPLPGYNRLTYTLVSKGFAAQRKSVNRFRENSLGLPPIHSSGQVLFPQGRGSIPILHAISPSVLKRPDDWPDHAHITGYWSLKKDTGFTPPEALARFLEVGAPPVFVGFGSMTSSDPDRLATIVTSALKQAGVRGIIGSGWADLKIETSDDVLAIGPAPYDWLFPKMSAVVHHGGAGTTAEGFRAGVPCVICPFFGDQPGWARLSEGLGVGAKPVPRKKLTADRLAASMKDAVSNPELRANAAKLAEDMSREDGVAAALDLIFHHLRH